MTVFLQFIVDNSHFIYSLVALVSLFYLRRALLARRERRSAIFPLEREVAMGRIYRTFGVAVLLIIIIAATWAAGNVLLPQMERFEAATTPEPEDLLVLIDTPSPTVPPPTATPTVTATSRPRPTRRPPAVQEAATPTPALRAPVCPIAGASISAPGNSQTANSVLTIKGVADIEGFQFYKLEWLYSGNPEQWNWFAGSERPVKGGVLGAFDPAGLPAGRYTIRLVVVDNTGNYPEPCTVTVIVP